MTKYFIPILVAVLIIFLYMKGCVNPGLPVTTVVHDTVDKWHAGTAVTVPGVVKYIPYPVDKIREIIKDTGRVVEIVKDYYAVNIQKDSLQLEDSLGTVSITDTVQNNLVKGRKWDYHIRERIITNTVTITQPAPVTRQLYYGFTLGSAMPFTSITEIGAGLQYKNRSNTILGIEGSYDLSTKSPVIRLSYYKKF